MKLKLLKHVKISLLFLFIVSNATAARHIQDHGMPPADYSEQHKKDFLFNWQMAPRLQAAIDLDDFEKGTAPRIEDVIGVYSGINVEWDRNKCDWSTGKPIITIFPVGEENISFIHGQAMIPILPFGDEIRTGNFGGDGVLNSEIVEFLNENLGHSSGVEITPSGLVWMLDNAYRSRLEMRAYKGDLLFKSTAMGTPPGTTPGFEGTHGGIRRLKRLDWDLPKLLNSWTWNKEKFPYVEKLDKCGDLLQ